WILQHSVLVINAVLRFKIVGIGRRPMLIQCHTYLLIAHSRILLLLLLIVHLGLTFDKKPNAFGESEYKTVCGRNGYTDGRPRNHKPLFGRGTPVHILYRQTRPYRGHIRVSWTTPRSKRTAKCFSPSTEYNPDTAKFRVGHSIRTVASVPSAS